MQESIFRPLDVFLVHDSEVVRRAMADRVALLPHIQPCGEARSIAEALSALIARRPDLVGSGAPGPDMGGLSRVALYAEDSNDDAFLLARAFEKAKAEGSLIVVPNGEEAIGYLAGEASSLRQSALPS